MFCSKCGKENNEKARFCKSCGAPFSGNSEVIDVDVLSSAEPGRSLSAWESYLKNWKEYAQFSGRARRRDFWMWSIFNFMAALAIAIALAVLGFGEDAISGLLGLASLAAILPGLSLMSRRLHDTGRSAYWLLMCFVPFIGPLILVGILGFVDGEKGVNRFGPNPKL